MADAADDIARVVTKLYESLGIRVEATETSRFITVKPPATALRIVTQQVPEFIVQYEIPKVEH